MEVSNFYRDFDIIFRPYTFEDFSREVVAEGQQTEYNKYISEKADYVIFIFDSNFGEKTLEELNVAMKTFLNKQKPIIYIYCNENGAKNDSSFKDFRLWCNEHNQYYISYEANNFKDKVKQDFTKVVMAKILMECDNASLDDSLTLELKKSVIERLWYALSNSTKSMFFMIQSEKKLDKELMSALREAKAVLPADMYATVMDYAIDVVQKGRNWILGEFRRYAEMGKESLGASELQQMHDTLINEVVKLDDAQRRINEIQKMLMDYCNNVLLKK